jgi:hypothetical protein
MGALKNDVPNHEESVHAATCLAATDCLVSRRTRDCLSYAPGQVVHLPASYTPRVVLDGLSEELAPIFRDTPKEQPPVPPAPLALVPLLQAYTGASDEEAIAALLMDRRGPLVLDWLDCEAPPLRKSAAPWSVFVPPWSTTGWTGGWWRARASWRRRIVVVRPGPYGRPWIRAPCGGAPPGWRRRRISWDTRCGRPCAWWRANRGGGWRQWPRRLGRRW